MRISSDIPFSMMLRGAALKGGEYSHPFKLTYNSSRWGTCMGFRTEVEANIYYALAKKHGKKIQKIEAFHGEGPNTGRSIWTSEES